MKNILENKVVLYVVLFFAVTNFFGYLLLNNYNAAIFMAIVGFIASQYSKNMIIILASAIVITSLFVGSQTISVKEGFNGNDDNEDKASNGGDKKSGFQVPLSPASLDEDEDSQEKDSDDDDNKKKQKKKKLDDDHVMPQSEKTQKRMTAKAPHAIDESATVEAAYKNLDKLLGSDAMSKMSKDAGHVLHNQKEVMANLESLEPLVNKATQMIETLDNSGALDKIEGMINKFGGMKKNKL